MLNSIRYFNQCAELTRGTACGCRSGLYWTRSTTFGCAGLSSLKSVGITTASAIHKLDTLLVGAVLRDGGWQIGVGDTHIRADERVIVVCRSLELKTIRKLFSA